MEKVVRKLVEIVEESEMQPSKKSPSVTTKSRLSVSRGPSKSFNPWTMSPTLPTALDTFASRLENQEDRQRLVELRAELRESLSQGALDAISGVYNDTTLYRFLRINEMDVRDSKSMVITNFHAREESKMDAKRELIVRKNLGYGTLPRAEEWREYQPFNPFLGRAKDGRLVDYYCFGSGADFDGAAKSFSVEEYVEVVMFGRELNWIVMDAFGAVEGRDIAYVTFYDCSGGSFGKLMSMMECELLVCFKDGVEKRLGEEEEGGVRG